MKLTNRQRVFVEHYLTCWNATEAARQAGYSARTANQQGPRLLVNVGIQAAIKARLAELQAGADEVLQRLTDHARGSIEPFLNEGNGLDLALARERKQLHLVHKLKQSTTVDTEGRVTRKVELELYDAQAALVQLGRHHKLFVDRQEVTGADGGAIEVKALDYRAGLTALAPGPVRHSDAPGADEGARDGAPLG